MSDTRGLIDASWSAARRVARRDGNVVTQTPATMAGLYLDAANGDALRALDMVPEDEGIFFELVRKDLRMVIAEENVLPEQRKTGS